MKRVGTVLISALLLTIGVAQAKEKNRSEDKVKQYYCSENVFKEECFEYMNDMSLYKSRKETFQKNKVKYFFNPDELTKGFKTPEPYNNMINEVFKSLKKSDISKTTYSISMRMKDKMKENFRKDIKKLSIDQTKKYDRNSVNFYTDYNRNYDNFLKKVDLFEKITKDYKNIGEFQNIISDIDKITYLFIENDMNESEYQKILNEEGHKNLMKCYYAQYEILRLDLDINIKCR